MLKSCLEILLVYDFILISVEQLEQLKYLLIHVLIFDHSKSNFTYIEIIAKNCESSTLSIFQEAFPVYLINCWTSQQAICRFIEIKISQTDLADMHPSLQQSKFVNTSAYYLNFSSLRYQTIQLQILIIMQTRLIDLTHYYYFNMRKFTVYDDWTTQNPDQNKKINRSEEMGLFTFYRQQAVSTEVYSNRYSEITTNNEAKSYDEITPYLNKSAKINKSFNFHKPHQTQNIVQFSPAQSRKKSINCEKFLKSIEETLYKPQYLSKKGSEVNSDDSFNRQNKLLQKLQNIKQQDQRQVKKYNIVLQSSHGFVARPLKDISQFGQISRDKIFIHRENNHVSLKSQNKSQTVSKDIEKQQNTSDSFIQVVRNIRKSQKTDPKVEKINQQKPLVNKTLQRQFLQKIRFNERSLKKENKQNISSSKMKDIREQNKRYLFNLLKNVYPLEKDDKQKIKTLNSTLKSNFVISKLKTEQSLSPDSKRALRKQKKPFYHKKNISHIQNEEQKFKNRAEYIDLRANINQKFKFIVQKQRVTNNHFYHNLQYIS